MFFVRADEVYISLHHIHIQIIFLVSRMNFYYSSNKLNLFFQSLELHLIFFLPYHAGWHGMGKYLFLVCYEVHIFSLVSARRIFRVKLEK